MATDMLDQPEMSAMEAEVDAADVVLSEEAKQRKDDADRWKREAERRGGAAEAAAARAAEEMKKSGAESVEEVKNARDNNDDDDDDGDDDGDDEVKDDEKERLPADTKPRKKRKAGRRKGARGHSRDPSDPFRVPTKDIPVGVGQLRIYRKPPMQHGAGLDEVDHDITHVLRVERLVHVVYDKVTGRFKGVPPEWAVELNAEFGLAYQHYRKHQVPGYVSQIPRVLSEMKAYLVGNGGLQEELVMRKTPNGRMVETVKAQLNRGDFEGCEDPNVVAQLLKIWFRELQPKIFTGLVSDKELSTDMKEDEAWEIVERFPEPQKSLLLWLLDLCGDIVEHQESNKMGFTDLGIVMAPNLYEMPRFILSILAKKRIEAFTLKFANFLENCIKHRLRHRPAHHDQPGSNHNNNNNNYEDDDGPGGGGGAGGGGRGKQKKRRKKRR